MKRILMIFVSVLFIICLIGCNEEEKIEEINIKFVIEENIYDIKKDVNYIVNIADIPNITEEDVEGIYYDSEYSNKYNNEVIKEDIILYVKKVFYNEYIYNEYIIKEMLYAGIGNIISKSFLVDYYSDYKFKNSNIYECKRLNETSYIAGYLSSETISILDNVRPFHMASAVCGIDDYIYRYQCAISTGIISVEEHPIKYLSIDNYEANLFYKQNRLIFILEKAKYSKTSINDDNIQDFYIYFKASYYIENETYKINKQNTKLDHLLYLSDFSETFTSEYLLDFFATEVIDLNGVKCILEPYKCIFQDPKGEEYYEKIKEAIISTKNEYPYGEMLIYDYEKWIEILKGEYRDEIN